MNLRKIILTGAFSVLLLSGTATVSLADEIKTIQNSVAPQASSHSDSHHESTPPTNPPVNNTTIDTSSSSSSNPQHESTPGMDPNMPGMGGKDDHGSTNSDEGVNGYVVGGFSLLNLLIIASAGILKLKSKPST